MPLDKLSAKPLFSQLEELIRAEIEEGRLQPGDRVASEMELAQKHGISRMTARRAIDNLVMDGYLFRQSGKGTYVAQSKTPFASGTVYSFSRSMQALGLAVVTQVLEQRSIPAPPVVSRDLGLEPGAQVIFISRLRFVENQPMAIHMSYVPADRYPTLLHADLTARPLNEIMEESGGPQIIASRDSVEAGLASSKEAALLGVRKGAPLLVLHGVVFGEGEIPVRATRSLFRGDHFRFFVDSTNIMQVRAPAASVAARGDQRTWLTLNATTPLAPRQGQ